MTHSLEALPLLYRGKGKDMREIPNHPELLLQVCRNTLSTHNVVHQTEIPGKGALIAAQTLYMELFVLKDMTTHIEEFGCDIYGVLPEGDYPSELHHQAFIVQRAAKPKVEIVIRAFNTGSLARTLKETGTDPYGLGLAGDLPLMHRFEKPVLTPTEKSATDDPLLANYVRTTYPAETATAFEAFVLAQRHLTARGITLIDAKFELQGSMLIDDWLNGDCARLALTDSVREGEDPPFYDKERFRQMALHTWAGGPKVPLSFTEEEARDGLGGYHAAFKQITGMALETFQKEFLDC